MDHQGVGIVSSLLSKIMRSALDSVLIPWLPMPILQAQLPQVLFGRERECQMQDTELLGFSHRHLGCVRAGTLRRQVEVTFKIGSFTKD